VSSYVNIHGSAVNLICLLIDVGTIQDLRSRDENRIRRVLVNKAMTPELLAYILLQPLAPGGDAILQNMLFRRSVE
jgi:hypothetical protein